MPADLRLAVIGDPVEHSLSPAIHRAALESSGLEGTCQQIRVTRDALSDWMATQGRQYDGLNITVPHKESVLPLVDELDEGAKAIAAINTVSRCDGRLNAFNTDATGFARVVAGLDSPAGAALIIGAGGAARACVHALLGLGWTVLVANRSARRAQDAFGAICTVIPLDQAPVQEALCQAAMLVNAGSGGMGQPDVSPLPAGTRLSADHTVVDLVYSPLNTRLLRAARIAGCHTVDGLHLLAAQAADSFEIWTGIRLEDSLFLEAARNAAGAAQTVSAGVPALTDARTANSHEPRANSRQPAAKGAAP